MEPSLEPQPEQRPAPSASREFVTGRASVWPSAAAVVAGLAVGVFLWSGPRRAPPAAPEAPVARPSEATLAVAQPPRVPVELPAPAQDESAGLRPFNPMDLECRPYSPAEPMSGARLVGRGSSRRATATILPGNAGSDHSVYLGSRLIGNTRGATGSSRSCHLFINEPYSREPRS